MQCEMGKTVEKTDVKNLFVSPSDIRLAGAELELAQLERREYRLRAALAQVKDDYDFIVIDCPPSLSLLTVNALTAAQSVLIPIQCEYYALRASPPCWTPSAASVTARTLPFSSKGSC